MMSDEEEEKETGYGSTPNSTIDGREHILYTVGTPYGRDKFRCTCYIIREIAKRFV